MRPSAVLPGVYTRPNGDPMPSILFAITVFGMIAAVPIATLFAQRRYLRRLKDGRVVAATQIEDE